MTTRRTTPSSAAMISDPAPETRGAADTELERLREGLRGHRLYGAVTTPAALRRFCEHHVVCVLDFMALLKSLQRELACVDVPWLPTADPAAARLVQSIALDEESDVRADGRVQSHFAWYLEAMDELGADSGPIRALVEDLRARRAASDGGTGGTGGSVLAAALANSELPPAARAFGAATAAVLDRPLWVRAAVFFHGREEIIPALFLPIVERLARAGLAAQTLVAYFERHIEVDGGEHGPLAAALLARLYGDSTARRAEAEEAALEALRARTALWSAIAAECDAQGPLPCERGVPAR